jgi:hypothetical protein
VKQHWVLLLTTDTNGPPWTVDHLIDYLDIPGTIYAQGADGKDDVTTVIVDELREDEGVPGWDGAGADVEAQRG